MSRRGDDLKCDEILQLVRSVTVKVKSSNPEEASVSLSKLESVCDHVSIR